MKRALVLCLVLAGCAASGRSGDGAPAVHDLGLPPSAPAVADPSPPLALQVRAPAWLDSTGIAYRLAYSEPGRVRAYSRARWAAAPANLVQQRLSQRLGLVPAGQGGAACLLHIELDEFSQVFATPRQSQGLLQARVSLLDRGRRPLAGKTLKLEAPAPSPDSSGGVAALGATVEQLADAIGGWRRELSAGGRLAACGKST